VDPFGQDVGGEQQPAVEDGGVVAHSHLAGRQLRQGLAEPIQKGEFAAQRGLRRTVGGRAARC
jgi:hypothetical protein